MELGLEGKTAVITGASRGIGLAIARALAREGVSLALVARTPERLAAAAASIGATLPAERPVAIHPVAADLGLRAEAERAAGTALEHLGRVDILVNNAAATHTGPFFSMPDELLVEAWQVKALGYMRLVRALAPHMIERRDGRIVNIVGGAARTPNLDFIAGSMVNAALVNFTRGISRELAPHNVRINSISPGWTLPERQGPGAGDDALQRQRSRAVPLHRLVSADEVATLALLLLSDRLPSMTGEDIVLDGGATTSM